jgi:hypothetical protein
VSQLGDHDDDTMTLERHQPNPARPMSATTDRAWRVLKSAAPTPTGGSRSYLLRTNYPLIVEAALKNGSSSFVIDGEAVLVGVDGISDSTGCILTSMMTRCSFISGVQSKALIYVPVPDRIAANTWCKIELQPLRLVRASSANRSTAGPISL